MPGRYLEVDLRKVYHYLQHDPGDFEQFAQYMGEYLARTHVLDSCVR